MNPHVCWLVVVCYNSLKLQESYTSITPIGALVQYETYSIDFIDFLRDLGSPFLYNLEEDQWNIKVLIITLKYLYFSFTVVCSSIFPVSNLKKREIYLRVCINLIQSF